MRMPRRLASLASPDSAAAGPPTSRTPNARSPTDALVASRRGVLRTGRRVGGPRALGALLGTRSRRRDDAPGRGLLPRVRGGCCWGCRSSANRATSTSSILPSATSRLVGGVRLHTTAGRIASSSRSAASSSPPSRTPRSTSRVRRHGALGARVADAALRATPHLSRRGARRAATRAALSKRGRRHARGRCTARHPRAETALESVSRAVDRVARLRRAGAAEGVPLERRASIAATCGGRARG